MFFSLKIPFPPFNPAFPLSSPLPQPLPPIPAPPCWSSHHCIRLSGQRRKQQFVHSTRRHCFRLLPHCCLHRHLFTPRRAWNAPLTCVWVGKVDVYVNRVFLVLPFIHTVSGGDRVVGYVGKSKYTGPRGGGSNFRNGSQSLRRFHS